MMTHIGGVYTKLNISTIKQQIFVKSLKYKCFMNDNFYWHPIMICRLFIQQGTSKINNLILPNQTTLFYFIS